MVGMGRSRQGSQQLCPGAGTPGAAKTLSHMVLRRMPDGGSSRSQIQPSLLLQAWPSGCCDALGMLLTGSYPLTSLLTATLHIVAMITLQTLFILSLLYWRICQEFWEWFSISYCCFRGWSFSYRYF